MTEKTEKKILESALTLFARNGYYGATTRLIADESGFSEVTLFRKFKTKKNLFNAVLTQNQDYILKDLGLILINIEYGNPRDFLKILIDGILDLANNNFNFIKIVLNEKCETSEKVLETFVNSLSQYIEKEFPGKNIDYRVFAFTILGFTYLLTFDKKLGRTFIDHDRVAEEFIDQSATLLD